MKIFEILKETTFESSDLKWFNERQNEFEVAIENFDAYVQHYGSKGANIKFNNLIDNVETIDWHMRIVAEADPKLQKSYNKMIDSKNRLKDRIDNSNWLSYE